MGWGGPTGPGQAQGDAPCANPAAPARLGPSDCHPVSTFIADRERVIFAGVGENVHEQDAAAVGCHPFEQDFDEIGVFGRFSPRCLPPSCPHDPPIATSEPDGILRVCADRHHRVTPCQFLFTRHQRENDCSEFSPVVGLFFLCSQRLGDISRVPFCEEDPSPCGGTGAAVVDGASIGENKTCLWGALGGGGPPPVLLDVVRPVFVRALLFGLVWRDGAASFGHGIVSNQGTFLPSMS